MSEDLTDANLVMICMRRLEDLLAYHNTINPSPVNSLSCHSEEDFEQARRVEGDLAAVKRELEFALGLYERAFKILTL